MKEVALQDVEIKEQGQLEKDFKLKRLAGAGVAAGVGEDAGDLGLAGAGVAAGVGEDAGDLGLAGAGVAAGVGEDAGDLGLAGAWGSLQG